MAIVFPDGTQNFPASVIKCTKMYDSNTRVSTGTNSATRLSNLDFWYNTTLQVGGSFTKIGSSTESLILVVGQANLRVNGNAHGFYAWIGTDTTYTEYVHIGDDQYTLAYPRNSAWAHRLQCCFTSLGAGTHTFKCAGGRGDGGSTNGQVNYNPDSDRGNNDAPNEVTRSQLLALEIAL